MGPKAPEKGKQLHDHMVTTPPWRTMWGTRNKTVFNAIILRTHLEFSFRKRLSKTTAIAKEELLIWGEGLNIKGKKQRLRKACNYCLPKDYSSYHYDGDKVIPVHEQYFHLKKTKKHNNCSSLITAHFRNCWHKVSALSGQAHVSFFRKKKLLFG